MRFLLTKELGRLVKWLRILGYDTEYFTQGNHSSLLIQALRDERIILTRNQHLPKHTGLRIILVQSQEMKEQLSEVLKTLNMRPNKDIMFSRCIICNEPLVPIEKEKIMQQVPEYVFKTQDKFITCPSCSRVYWQGTHWGNVQHCLEEIEGNA